MKLFLSFLFLSITISLNSCISIFSKKNAGEMKEKTFSVEQYTNLKVRGFCEIILTNSEQGKIKIIAGEDIVDKIIIQSANNELYISFEELNAYNLKGTKLYIPATNINSISTIGAGTLTTEFTLKADTISCDFSGAGDIHMDIECNSLMIRANGASNLYFKGSTNDLNLKCSGAVNSNTEKIIAQSMILDIQGASKISAYCSKSISGKIYGASAVTIYGNPINRKIQHQGVGVVNFN